jgi:hypothetical protein
MAPGAGDQEACDKPRNRNDFERRIQAASAIGGGELKMACGVQ